MKYLRTLFVPLYAVAQVPVCDFRGFLPGFEDLLWEACQVRKGGHPGSSCSPVLITQKLPNGP